jgi:hypothetical protein
LQLQRGMASGEKERSRVGANQWRSRKNARHRGLAEVRLAQFREAAFVDDFAQAFADVEAKDDFVARFNAGAGFDGHAIEFNPFAVDEVLAFAALQLEAAVGFQGKRSSFARDSLASNTGFRASIFPGEGGARGGLGASRGGVRQEREP